jgi:hypothetical protein
MARTTQPTTERAATISADAIRLRGIPVSLSGIIAGGASQSGDVTIALESYPTKDAALEVHVQIDIDPRIIRVMLPAETPPGSYQGTLTNGDAGRQPVVLDVEPAPHLRVVPEQMRLVDVTPGATVHRSLTVLNSGNVPVELRRVQAFGVFMAGGVERALRRGYVRTFARNERRVDIITDHLADAHGGLVRMAITQGAGTIAPGALQPIEVDVKIPSGLASGAVYGGNWELNGLVYPVTITVAGTPADPVDADEIEAAEKPDTTAKPGKTERADKSDKTVKTDYTGAES